MKKLCVLLVLALALACAPAMAAEGDAMLARTEDNYIYFNYCFTSGDMLYAVSYSSLCTYRLGDADMTEYTYVMPEDDGSYDYGILPFADGDRLYALELVTHYGEATEFEGAKLVTMTLMDDNTIVFEEVLSELDWDDLVEYYDSSTYPVRPDGMACLDGKLMLRCYEPNGNGYMMYAIDLDTYEREEISDLRDAYTFTPYKDGTLLVEQYTYEQPGVARLVAYDPASGSTQQLAQFEISDYSPLNGLAYDAATDTLYCVRAGEVCPVDVATGAVLEGVTDMPVESYGSPGQSCVLEGGYYAFCSEGMVIRNLDPAQKADIRLKINDSGWSEAVNAAYYRFSNAHGDVSVVLSRDYSEQEKLIESMMNRDDSVDIYTLSTSSAIYSALYNRGYLMELDGSEKLAALAQGMYPSLAEDLSSDGHLVALPLSTYAYTLGINEKALEALGLSMADVPDNWSDFLDFLKGLEGVISENGRVKLFYPGYSDADARNELFTSIFEDYQRYVNKNDPAMGYNTEIMRGLMQKLEQIDFVAMGCIREEDREEFDYDQYEYTDDGTLLQTGTGCSIGNFYSGYTPVLLGMAPGLKTPITLETTVAIVNPFTKHPDVALAFLEEVAENLPDTTRYCVDPSLSEPVRGKWNEEALAEFQRQLDELNRDLETADAMDKQMIEDSIRDTEETLKYYEEYGWDVGPADLEWYRANDEGVSVAGVNWLYSDDSGEAWELINQYRDGQITAEEMLAGIDRKVQMMLLEGN